jgi:type IV pilus assembly protein PilC
MTATISSSRTFDFEAIDAAGNRSKGKIEASTDAAAAAALRQQGMTPLTLAEAGRGLNRDITIPGLSGRVTTKDLAVLSRQFATMTSSGLSLLRSLAILEDQATNPKLQKALHDVRREIEGGSSLSGAMKKQDRIFPRLMIAMIEAGETGGFLDQALDRIATNFEKDANLRAKIKSAMTALPVVAPTMSRACITGTPTLSSVPRLREKRLIAILVNSLPKTGSLSLSRSKPSRQA